MRGRKPRPTSLILGPDNGPPRRRLRRNVGVGRSEALRHSGLPAALAHGNVVALRQRKGPILLPGQTKEGEMRRKCVHDNDTHNAGFGQLCYTDSYITCYNAEILRRVKWQMTR